MSKQVFGSFYQQVSGIIFNKFWYNELKQDSMDMVGQWKSLFEMDGSIHLKNSLNRQILKATAWRFFRKINLKYINE